jgi:hypothetical protein
MICLVDAGKTTLTYQMTLGQAVATAPTVGSNTEHFTFKNLRFLLWDVGGQASLRASWTQYLANTDAVVFVFDSTDRERAQLAREELHRVAGDEVGVEFALEASIYADLAFLYFSKHPKRQFFSLRTSVSVICTSRCAISLCVLASPTEDVAGCMTPADISESLALTSLRLQNWHIQGCSALTGKGCV